MTATRLRTLAIDVLPPLLIVGLLVAAWESLPSLGVNTRVIPPPSLVLATLADKAGVYADNLLTTLSEMVIGFALGLVVGLAVAFVTVYSSIGRRVISPLVVTSQTIPVIALAPLLVILLGVGIEPRAIIVTLGVFFPIALNTAAGLRSADREIVNLLKSFGADRFAIFRSVELPSALPFIFTGVQIGVTYSVIGAVVSEWVGSGEGLGKLMLLRQSALGIELSYGAVVLTAIVALLLFGTVVLIRRRVMPWETRDAGG